MKFKFKSVFKQQINRESDALIAEARRRIEAMSPVMTQIARSKQVASMLLRKQRHYVLEVMEEGFLDRKEAAHMLELIAHDMHNISKSKKKEARGAARQAFASSSSLVRSLTRDAERPPPPGSKGVRSLKRAAAQRRTSAAAELAGVVKRFDSPSKRPVA